MYIVTKDQHFCGVFATIEAAMAAIETKIQHMNARRERKNPGKTHLLWKLTDTITGEEMEAPNYGCWPVDGQCAKFVKQFIYEKCDFEEDIDDTEMYDDTYFDIYLAE